MNEPGSLVEYTEKSFLERSVASCNFILYDLKGGALK